MSVEGRDCETPEGYRQTGEEEVKDYASLTQDEKEAANAETRAMLWLGAMALNRNPNDVDALWALQEMDRLRSQAMTEDAKQAEELWEQLEELLDKLFSDPHMGELLIFLPGKHRHLRFTKDGKFFYSSNTGMIGP